MVSVVARESDDSYNSLNLLVKIYLVLYVRTKKKQTICLVLYLRLNQTGIILSPPLARPHSLSCSHTFYILLNCGLASTDMFNTSAAQQADLTRLIHLDKPELIWKPTDN